MLNDVRVRDIFDQFFILLSGQLCVCPHVRPVHLPFCVFDAIPSSHIIIPFLPILSYLVSHYSIFLFNPILLVYFLPCPILSILSSLIVSYLPYPTLPYPTLPCSCQFCLLQPNSILSYSFFSSHLRHIPCFLKGAQLADFIACEDQSTQLYRTITRYRTCILFVVHRFIFFTLYAMLHSDLCIF